MTVTFSFNRRKILLLSPGWGKFGTWHTFENNLEKAVSKFHCQSNMERAWESSGPSIKMLNWKAALLSSLREWVKRLKVKRQVNKDTHSFLGKRSRSRSPLVPVLAGTLKLNVITCCRLSADYLRAKIWSTVFNKGTKACQETKMVVFFFKKWC
jgi:hypothetical protein